MKDYLNSGIRTSLQELGIQKNFTTGQIIQFQDDRVEDLYVLETGLAVARCYEHNGKESWIDSFNTGDLIGVEHIHTGGPSQCQITAQSSVSVLQFKRKTFTERMISDHELNFFVIQQLTSRLKKFQDSRAESHMLSKRGRVASEIRRMAERAETESGYVVSPKPVISDMALRLGIARETVSRTVSDLVKNQVLQRGTSGYIVPDLGRLEAHMR